MFIFAVAAAAVTASALFGECKGEREREGSGTKRKNRDAEFCAHPLILPEGVVEKRMNAVGR